MSCVSSTLTGYIEKSLCSEGMSHPPIEWKTIIKRIFLKEHSIDNTPPPKKKAFSVKDKSICV